MISLTVIHEPRNQTPENLVIALTGRGVSAGNMLGFVMEMGLDKSIIVSIEPLNREWYPLPNGMYDQENAIIGIKKEVNVISNRIDKFKKMFNFEQNKTALIGYSAGGVMALKLVEISEYSYGAVVCVAGAILNPSELIPAHNDSPILLRHNMDDECFSWEERYLPTRDALFSKGYNLYVEEQLIGGHGVCLEDAHVAGRFIKSNIK